MLHPKAQLLPCTQSSAMVLLKDGTLLSVKDNFALSSSDGGRTWSSTPLFGDTTAQARFEYALIPCSDGTLVLVYLDAATRSWGWDNETHAPQPDSRLEVHSVRSHDGGKTWSEPVRVSDGYCGAIINGIQTSSGRIVVPVQRLLYNPGRHAQVTYCSDDGGLTWQQSNVLDIGGHGHHDGVFEGCVLEKIDGRLWMLLRTNLDKFWQAHSEDGGLTWIEFEPTAIDASSAPAYVIRLHSGRLIMAWNRLYPEGLTDQQKQEWERAGGDCNVCQPIASWHRRELSIAFSNDDGNTWSTPTVLLSGKKPSYPFIMEPEPGEIWVTTRFGQRTAVRFKEADFVQNANPQPSTHNQPSA